MTSEEWLFGNRADEGEAVGRAHSGDIVPTGAGGKRRVGAKGEIEEGAELFSVNSLSKQRTLVPRARYRGKTSAPMSVLYLTG